MSTNSPDLGAGKGSAGAAIVEMEKAVPTAILCQEETGQHAVRSVNRLGKISNQCSNRRQLPRLIWPNLSRLIPFRALRAPFATRVAFVRNVCYFSAVICFTIDQLKNLKPGSSR